MKYICRKPLLPSVLLVLMIFSLCFMTLFRQSILDNLLTVDKMYNSIQLTFQVLSGANTDNVLQLKDQTVTSIQAVEGVADCFYYLECPFSMRAPIQVANYSTVYGTNDLNFFSKERDIEITYGDGWDKDSVLIVEQSGVIPCILEVNMAAVMGLKTGDTFVVAPNANEDVDPQSAPSLNMVVAGTFTNNAGLLDYYSVIVSSDTFTGSPGFLYNDSMRESYYYYRTFHFQTNPAYNYDFQTIKDEVTSILNKDGDFILYSNVRILEKAVRPIEQKIRIQQMLVTPLSILLCISVAVMAMLLCSGFSTEILLRLCLGEKRWTVWLRMMSSLILLMVTEGVIALLIVRFVCGTQLILWAMQYLLLNVGLCIIAMAIQLAVFCNKNLVAFYQSKEE